MISVGKGEKCMRLWNLVTGKKAGVLNFGREILSEVGEGKYGRGEGRKVAWGSTDAGEEFCVGFERGILVFGMDSRPRCKVVPDPRTKIHQLCYISISEDGESSVLALSTEDGRILFYSTRPDDVAAAVAAEGEDAPMPLGKVIAQVGGKESGVSGRIKDFKTLKVGDKAGSLIIIGGSSDGCIRLWQLQCSDLQAQTPGYEPKKARLLGSYETGNRITCLEGFVMVHRAEGAGRDEEERVERIDQDGSSNSE
jgi:protein MAK11